MVEIAETVEFKLDLKFRAPVHEAAGSSGNPNPATGGRRAAQYRSTGPEGDMIGKLKFYLYPVVIEQTGARVLYAEPMRLQTYGHLIVTPNTMVIPSKASDRHMSNQRRLERSSARKKYASQFNVIYNLALLCASKRTFKSSAALAISSMNRALGISLREVTVNWRRSRE